MREIELDGVSSPKRAHRSKNTDTAKKSDTSVDALRNTYGDAVAAGVRGDTKFENLVRDVASDFRRTPDAERSTRRRK